VQHKFQGALLILVATFLFAIHDASSKYLMAFFAVPLIVWARFLVNLILMLVVVAPGMGRELIVTRRPWLMIFRGLLLAVCSMLVQLAFRTLPLAETSALIFITPLLVALLAGPVLGEKVSLKSWLATVAGFAGVLLIARPGGAMFGIGVIYALGAALCYAVYQLLTRKLSTTEPAMRQLFYTALMGTLSMSLVIPMYWTGDIPTLKQAMIITSLGIYAGIGHFLLIRAFRDTQAATLSSLLYVQLVWATLLGWIIFNQLPDLLATLGMLIVGGSSLSLALHQPRTGRPSPAQDSTCGS